MCSSTKDQSFTDINVSTLKSEELKEALSSVSIMSQLGQFFPATGIRDAVTGKNATARNMGAAIGGILDNFRGGTVEFTSKGLNTNYNDTRSLNDLTQAEQDRLGKVAAATVKQAEVVFFDYNPKTKEKTARQQKDVVVSLDKYAKEFGIKRGNKSITQYTREITNRIAAKEQQKIQDVIDTNIARGIEAEDDQQNYGQTFDFGDRGAENVSTGTGNLGAGVGIDTYDSSSEPSYDSSYSDTGSYSDTSSEGSYEDDDMYNKGGLAGKKKTPKTKKMKRGGLASR